MRQSVVLRKVLVMFTQAAFVIALLLGHEQVI